jgi:hypothetical protein
MYANGAADGLELPGELDGPTAGGQVCPDCQDPVYTFVERMLNHLHAIGIESRVVQVGVGIDEQQSPLRA